MTYDINEDNIQKLRMIEINTYYSKRYKAHIELMKLIIVFLIPIILLSVLLKKRILPPLIFKFIIMLICIIGAYFIFSKIWDLIRRDNIVFDKISWQFNPKTLDKVDTTNKHWLLKDVKDECKKTDVSEICYGDDCCDRGTVYDKNKKKCVVSDEGFQNNRALLKTYTCYPWNGINNSYSPNDCINNKNNYTPII